jgi:hypothetical protein
MQVDFFREFGYTGGMRIRTDFLYDDIPGGRDIDLEEGDGWIDLREANFTWYPLDFMDLKIGRQILTWGTGDLAFLNDLFPKDWRSFFIGRDVEYLKAPSDAVRASLFGSWFNVEVIYVPRFDPDRFIRGERITYWNGSRGEFAGRNAVIRADVPDEWFEDHEVALRMYRNFGGVETALYAYRGFWKSPAGSDPATLRAVFPELEVYGASVRGNFLKGIGNAEFAIYDSREDASGDDPWIRNGEYRFLFGYDQEIAKNMTLGIQYYLEWIRDYDRYRETLPPGTFPRDEDRHLVTLRLTKTALKQNLTLSLFVFYSPSDEDAYYRPKMSYQFSDHWSAEAGANIFEGENDQTFFGQFTLNDNGYARVRYAF